jgi:23S rRNA (cytosine1962-C5)-methyltransferase
VAIKCCFSGYPAWSAPIATRIECDYTMPTVAISPRGEDRARAGHPWIYRSDVARPQAAAGDLVEVIGAHGRTAGYALFSDRSEITLRMISFGPSPPAPGFIRDRLEAAIAFRTSLGLDATAYRLVHGEADRIPSLIVDRYGDYLVVQTLSQGTDRRVDEITAALVALLHPAGILARNDPRVRVLEGLEQKVKVLYGEVPDRVEIREGAVRYQVDPWRGQKTGLFLDQRENREAALRYARGRLLDGFSYHGGFALALAPRCRSVLAVDISEDAVARIRENAARNGLTHVEARAMNVFDELRELERTGARFETIVLDPPAFAKNKASVGKALSGYKEINLRALKLLEAGGFLITCSCSYNVSESMFLDVVAEAAADARAEVSVVEKRTQGRDHPILINVPETYYLKCLILRKLA